MDSDRHPGDILSIDVEEYFHATLFKERIPRKEWKEREGRAAGSVDILLRHLDDWGVKGTWFVLGWFAERNRAVVRAISDAGHEIASHGFDHTLLGELGPDAFREDLRRSRGVLEEITEKRVVGYRAPTFSITSGTLWALPILAEEGYLYDSSIFPVHHDRYGIPGFPRHPVRLSFDTGEIVEFPLNTWRLFGFNLPVSGGGYLRLLPFPAIRHGLRAIRREKGIVMLYIHPWEIDPDQPRLPLPPLSRFRHYHALARTAKKLQALIADGRFTTAANVLQKIDPPRHDLPT